jgi:hypothetical protein
VFINDVGAGRGPLRPGLLACVGADAEPMVELVDSGLFSDCGAADATVGAGTAVVTAAGAALVDPAAPTGAVMVAVEGGGVSSGREKKHSY